MGHALAQVRFQRDSLLPEDVVINTFHFLTPTNENVSVAEATAIATRLEAFYKVVHAPGTVTLQSFMADTLADNHEIRVYDLDDPQPRAPVLTHPWQLFAPAGTSLPNEVALCLSFRGAMESGTVPARRRGRVYLGPFATGGLAGTETASDSRPISGLINAAAGAGVDLAQDNQTAGASVWSVFSEVSDELIPVTAVWVDDAWDTQRRRGARATSRVTLLPSFT